MSITNELRAWASVEVPYKYGHQLNAIADRIDAEHEEALGSKVVMAISTGEDGNEFVSMPAKELSECYMELPKDADGEPIHVGDWMTPNGMGMDFKVRQMHFNGEWSLDLEGFGISQTCPDMCHHHHALTVEDMLWDLLGDIRPDMEDEEAVPIVAAYAKRLRLVDGKEQQ